jgi:hypothetical protein
LRALAQELLSGDLGGTVLTVTRLTDAIGRALKVRQVLEAGDESALDDWSDPAERASAEALEPG